MADLPLVSGETLPPLGWQHDSTFDMSRIEPVRNRDDFRAKPGGGLWTSPLREGLTGESITGWTQWCRDNDFANPNAPITQVVANPTARVYVVDSHEDLLVLKKHYGQPPPDPPFEFKMWTVLDWPKLANDIDAVWLTEKGEWTTRYCDYGWNGWDCETVYWLNLCFRPDVDGQ